MTVGLLRSVGLADALDVREAHDIVEHWNLPLYDLDLSSNKVAESTLIEERRRERRRTLWMEEDHDILLRQP